tara:strand:- start:14 stop:430 length:417 start_codon:yes stop_codon:yes gene_type:complete
MVKKGGSNLDSVIQPFTGETNGAQAAANDGQAAGEFHSALIQNAGSSGSIEVPTFSGNPEASDSSALINDTLINNVNNAGGDIVGGKKRKSKKNKSKSKKNKSKSKKNKPKSKSKSKSKSKKSKSKSKKSKSKSKKRV